MSWALSLMSDFVNSGIQKIVKDLFQFMLLWSTVEQMENKINCSQEGNQPRDMHMLIQKDGLSQESSKILRHSI